jgi:quercetin dioxygenase-like cupin family protein
MRINADFKVAAVEHTANMAWVDSYMPGVQRKMLDRLKAESGRATSIVRYAPNSYFAPHTHDGGEEFLVLHGTFSDEHGDFPAGTYVRNPIGTQHKPHSRDGCIIFVKLWQFDLKDTRQFDRNTQQANWTEVTAEISKLLLHEFDSEKVQLLHANQNGAIDISGAGGIECLVLEGTCALGTTTYQKDDWLRLPDTTVTMNLSKNSRVYLKTGHLTQA